MRASAVATRSNRPPRRARFHYPVFRPLVDERGPDRAVPHSDRPPTIATAFPPGRRGGSGRGYGVGISNDGRPSGGYRRSALPFSIGSRRAASAVTAAVDGYTRACMHSRCSVVRVCLSYHITTNGEFCFSTWFILRKNLYTKYGSDRAYGTRLT